MGNVHSGMPLWMLERKSVFFNEPGLKSINRMPTSGAMKHHKKVMEVWNQVMIKPERDEKDQNGDRAFGD